VSKSRDVVRRIAKEAKRHGLEFAVVREGANHTVYILDGLMIPIPRHREIGDGLTEAIYKKKLGKGWWKR
jgi:hypothetical protein